MNLLVLNLSMDVGHTALGFTTSWTNALARRSSHVSVITHFKGELAVEPNVSVYSLGKERGWSEPRRLLEFYRLVHRVQRERPIDACFAHMAPLFASLFAPVAWARRIPVLLWYAHAGVPLTVRVAHALSDRCVTSTPSAFSLKSDKLFLLGQGIDTDVFHPPQALGSDYERTALSIGRLSRVKRIDEMLTALAIVRERHGIDLRLELVGGPLTTDDERYAASLREQVRSLGLGDAVEFAGNVPFAAIPDRYHRGGLFLHLTDTSLDKTVLESMASGCVPVSSNQWFRSMAAEEGLGWLVPEPGPEGLAETVARASSLATEERAALSGRLRRIVKDQHSLDALADKLMLHLTELAGQRAGGRAKRAAPGTRA